MQAQNSLHRHLERRLGTAELFGEFMGEAFGEFEMGEELRGSHRRQFGVVFERGLRDGLGRGEFEKERQQPACRQWKAQRTRDEREQRTHRL